MILDAEELLDELGECIFLAERVSEGGAARLVAGTAWSEKVAATFALDCVDHILAAVPGSADAELPGGGTLGAIIESARESPRDRDGRERPSPRVRLAHWLTARRLGRSGRDVGDAAFVAATQDEGGDLDVMDDAAWDTLAAARDAVLAAVESVRHVAIPFLVDRETRRYEALEERKAQANVDEVDTPWGRFPVRGAPKYPPAWVAGRDAAERSRQAALDLGGPSMGEEERSWQSGRLVELLGTE